MVGFQKYNTFKNDIKELKQFYDFTSHLFEEENKRLEILRKDKSKKADTITTTTRLVNHSINSLYQSTSEKYPDKLRQLILISSITILEVFLTDLIGEIFKRDKTPFSEQVPIEFMRNKVLNLSDIKYLHDELIQRDKRRLTSGGFNDISKYFKGKFNIDFKKFPISIKKLEEMHVRRHIHVHRNGICDKEYADKYPRSGHSIGDRINIDHSYMVNVLNTLSDFGAEVNKAVLNLYPNHSKGISHYFGPKSTNPSAEVQKILIELKLNKGTFDMIGYLKNLQNRYGKFDKYIAQISLANSDCRVIVVGDPKEIRSFIWNLKTEINFDLKNITELKI